MHRYRIAFLGGLAAGFIVGTRAGRERYEQMKKLARRTTDSPAVQQAAGAVQAQATGMLQSARHKLADELHERAPWLPESARHMVAGHAPGRRGGDAGVRNAGAHDGPGVTGEPRVVTASDRDNGRAPS